MYHGTYSGMPMYFISVLIVVWFYQICLAQSTCHPCHCSIQYSRQLNRWMNRADCQNKSISYFPLNLPRSVKAIDISHNKLNYESLLNLQLYTNLLTLSLAHCQLTSLPNNLFRNQSLLRELDLTGNDLLGLHMDTFQGLTSLRFMAGLNTEFIKGDSFQGMHQLREIEITLHQTSIPANLFNGLQIKKLFFHLTGAVTLPHEIFHIANHSLQEVTLIGEQITSLPESLFHQLVMLHDVKIKTPRLGILPETSFTGASGKLPSLSSAPLNLAFVDLEGMRVVPPELFQYQQSLETLKLSDIETIPNDIFAHLETLNSLDISGCRLSEIPELRGLNGLKSLNMSNTNLEGIKPDILSGLHSLKVLDLSYNKLMYIPTGVLRDVGITLQHLNLSHNNLIILHPSAFDNVLALRSLNLAYNNIKVLSSMQFWTLHNLRHLDLSHNSLKVLPSSVFAKQEDLVSLILANNKLQEIPAHLLDNTLALRLFDISNNRLVYLPPDIMQAFDLLSFQGNPIHCDCILFEMLRRNKKSEIRGQCASPTELVGTLLRDLNIAALCTTVPPTPAKITTTATMTSSPTTTPSTTSQESTTQLLPTPLPTADPTTRELEFPGDVEYVVTPLAILTSQNAFLQSPWFLALMATLVFIILLVGCIKFVRCRTRTRVYEVNSCQ